MNIEEIIRRVRQEASDQTDATVKPGGDVNAFLQDTEFCKKGEYHINQLLTIDKKNLVSMVYRCLLRRPPDAAADTYLSQLLSGELSPLAFVAAIRFSPEGKHEGVPVHGLRTRWIISRGKKIPFLGYFLNLAITLVRLSALKTQLLELTELHQQFKEKLLDKIDILEFEHQDFADQISCKADKQELELKADKQELELKADRLDVERKADSSELAAYREGLHYTESYFHLINRDLQSLLDQLKEQVPTEFGTNKASDLIHQLADGEFDKLYLDFEYQYRGTPAEVSAFLTAYADLLTPGTATPIPKKMALDLGCGRGEMVCYLEQLGYAANGVDLNRLAVDLCCEQGLQVECGDALSYLNYIEDDSVSVISSLHLIEHLSHLDLFLLLQRALLVLKPGGMLLLETPNPRNLLVGAGDFYRDFTHKNPIFPDTLEFLLNYFGYTQTETLYFEDKDGYNRRLISGGTVHFDDLNDYLEVSRDYAVIGYKPCE